MKISKEVFVEVAKINKGIIESEKEIVRLKEEVVKLKRRREEIARSEKSKLKPNYKYEVNVFTARNDRFFEDLQEGDEYIVITATLQNSDEFERLTEMFGGCIGPVVYQKKSTRYYVRYGVLFREGGGHLILRDKIPCNNNEWEELKKGNIAKKFIR